MQEFTCNVNEPFRSLLLDGSKEYEGRVFKEKWSQMKVGDRLTVRGGLDKTEIIFTIIGIVKCANFEELHELLGDKLLPIGMTSDIYNNLFSKEDIEKYGVVGIHLER